MKDDHEIQNRGGVLRINSLSLGVKSSNIRRELIVNGVNVPLKNNTKSEKCKLSFEDLTFKPGDRLYIKILS